MEDPAQEIADVVRVLTQGPPSKQKAAVEKYFTATAAFTHPFCATKSWSLKVPGLGYFDSRWATLQIYQWYKILSPDIELEVESVTFNKDHLKLYLDIQQHFKLWFVPFYDANVRLTTVIDLLEGNEDGSSSALVDRHSRAQADKPYSYASVADPERINGRRTAFYYISSQNDLYQTSEWIKFLLPWGIGYALVVAWQLFATLLCIIGAFAFFPQTWWKEQSFFDPPRKV